MNNNLLPDKYLDKICPIKNPVKEICRCGNSVDLVIYEGELLCPDCLREEKQNKKDSNDADNWRGYNGWHENSLYDL